jgi:hypothetical protein
MKDITDYTVKKKHFGQSYTGFAAQTRFDVSMSIARKKCTV